MTEFLHWWTGELSAMIPAGWRERFSASGIAYLAVEGDQWRVFRPAAGRLVETGRASLPALEGGEGRAAFRRLVADSAGGTGNVWLVLPRESVLRRTASLPLAAEEALRDAVGFELDRLTPLSEDKACFDCRITGRDAVTQSLSLEVAVTARAPVAARLAQLRDLGATVLGIGVEGDVAATALPFNLLGPEERDRPAISRAVIAARLLAVLVMALAIAALVFPLWQKREAVIGLQPRLDRAKAGADVADRLAREIEKLAAEHNFLVARRQGHHTAVVLLEELSRLLPDTTWVQQLDIKAGPKTREVQIAGETGSSSQLIEVLEKSGTLTNASFKSPLTKGVTPGTERFLLAAEVKPRRLPEPLPEAALASAAPVAQPIGAGAASVAPGAAVVPGPAASPPGPTTAASPSGATPGGPVPAIVPAGSTPGVPVSPRPPAASTDSGISRTASDRETVAPAPKGAEPALPAKPAPKG